MESPPQQASVFLHDAIKREIDLAVEAGVTLTLDEWQRYEPWAQQYWLEARARVRMVEQACLCKMLTHALYGDLSFAEDAVYEELDEAAQDHLINQRAIAASVREHILERNA